jgi:hypothetical protein
MSTLAKRIDTIERWLGEQIGVDLGEPPAPPVDETAEPAPPRPLTVEERLARLELAAMSNGFTLGGV